MGVILPGDAGDGDRLREIDDQLRAADPKREVEIRPYGVRRHLVMWSGGERSTAALLRLVEESDHPVHVHHIMSTGRVDRQLDSDSLGGHAVSDVTAMLHDIRRRSRPFKATMSAIGPSRVVGHTHRTTIVAYFAAQAAMSWRMQLQDRVVLGSWGTYADGREEPSVIYGTGEVLAPMMLKAVMRSEDGPQFSIG